MQPDSAASHARSLYVPAEPIREIVRRRDCNLSELARRANVDVRTIRRLLNGSPSHPRFKGELVGIDVADRLCIALGEMLP